MKIKLIGIFLCMLLILTSIQISGNVLKTNKIIENDEINTFSNGNKWMKTFGGNTVDFGLDVIQTDDGGYAVIGMTASLQTQNISIWLIKIDSAGNKQWDKKIADDGFGISIEQTDDGGFIILGWVVFGNVSQLHTQLLVKTDNSGNIQWSKKIENEYLFTATDLICTSDSGFLIVGWGDNPNNNDSDAFLIKTDSMGNILWNKTYIDEDYEMGISVKETLDGGYVFTGNKGTFDEGNRELWLVKTESNGELIWEKSFGEQTDNLGISFQITDDGGFIITGERDKDFLLIKTDSNGELLWEKTYDETIFDFGYSVDQASDGGYIIAGSIHQSVPSSIGVLIKTDNSGTLEWIKSFNNYRVNELFSVKTTVDNGYIATGILKSSLFDIDVLLIKTDFNGNIPRSRDYHSPLYRLFQRIFNFFPIFNPIFNRINI